jgi:excisionase family DNA binding protein
MSNQATPQLITIQTASELLNVHPNTIRNLIYRGELQAERIGARIVRLHKADVQALLTPYKAGEYGVWAINSVSHGSDSGAVL